MVLYFYPEGRHLGLHRRSLRVSRLVPRLRQDRRDGDRHVAATSVASHDKFKKKYELPFILASDTDGKVCENYGVWVEKSMYGRKYMGIDRSTFLIDKDGVVRGVWHKVKVPGHVAEVLKAVQAL